MPAAPSPRRLNLLGRNFSSDHVAPACPAILSAVNQANEGFVTSYGGDDLTAKLQSMASDLFEKQVAIFPVTSGTAAGTGLPAGTHAKTGTAQYGPPTPPRTDAWLVK